ncbi:class I SAM-dependent methyltransferase [Oceanobacillus sp. CAU 1775]
MKVQDAYNFYQKQFEMFKDELDLTTLNTQLAEEINEQVGSPFSNVLELGAGNGQLARSLATVNRKVTTVELVPELVEFAEEFKAPNVTSYCGSFYDIKLPETYDCILYIDGFGVGTDEEQLTLLQRIHDWLDDNGVALIDIYQPEYWKKVSGEQMKPFNDSKITRVYGYDEKNNRMTDTWWEQGNPEDKVTQSLACYTPKEIESLCKAANLQITGYFPGGAMDFKNWQYHEVVGLSECLSCRIKLRKIS